MACKEEGMVNVVSRKCHCGRAVPNFGAAGQKKRTHCAQCKEPGMVNLSKNPAARQPLPQIPVGPPPMMLSPQDAMIGMHAHHQVSMGQQVTPLVPYQEQCVALASSLLLSLTPGACAITAYGRASELQMLTASCFDMQFMTLWAHWPADYSESAVP